MRKLVLILLAVCAWAGQAEKQVGYLVQNWSTANGLPHDVVEALIQTRDGFIWFTTPSGIVRFDGVNFRVFSADTTKGIASDLYSRVLFEDKSGAIWVGTEHDGVIRFKNGEFQTFPPGTDLPSGAVTRIDEDPHGTVWIFTVRGLARWNNGRLSRVAPAPDSPFNAYLDPPPQPVRSSSLASKEFGLWRIRSNRWERFAFGNWSVFPVPDRITEPARLLIRSMAEDSQGRIWYDLLDDTHHYYGVSQNRLSTFNHFAGYHDGAFVTYQDRDGFLWLSDHQGSTALWKAGHLLRIGSMSTSEVFQVIEDHEGGIWIGTRDAGLFHLQKPTIQTFRPPGEAEMGISILKDRTDEHSEILWMGSIGLRRKDGQNYSLFLRKQFPRLRWARNLIQALYRDTTGALWVGTREGLVTFQNGRFAGLPISDQPDMNVTAISGAEDGRVAVGTDRGIFLWNGGRYRRPDLNNGEELFSVRTLLYVNNRLWVGHTNGLSSFCKGIQVREPALAHWSYGPVSALFMDNSKALWIGTEQNGLLRLFAGNLTHYTKAEGLPEMGIAQILEDDLGFLWYGGRSGLFRLPKRELEEYASGGRPHITYTRFGREDGLWRTHFMSSGQPGCFKASDGKLWFTTPGSVAVVDPSRIPVDNQKPVAIINECLVDRQSRRCSQRLTMQPEEHDLAVQYTALDSIKPEQIRFKYKLTGLDADWVDAGTRRTAYYSHLPPGSFRFQVIAASSDGVWNAVGSDLAVIVLPRFYRTWWFILCCLGLAFWSLRAIWKRRLDELKKAHTLQQAYSRELIASQENERKRIAAELHDSLGQHLVIINNLALLALEAQEQPRVTAGLRDISAETTQAMNAVKEISYNLRPFRLDRLGLTKTLEWIVRATAAASHIDITADVASVDGVLPKDSEINLFRIVQECLNNTVKHAQATHAIVSVTVAGNKLRLVISDNGKGFQPQAVPGDQATGFGLIGISERALLLGGQATVESIPNIGTTVTVEVEFKR